MKNSYSAEAAAHCVKSLRTMYFALVTASAVSLLLTLQSLEADRIQVASQELSIAYENLKQGSSETLDRTLTSLVTEADPEARAYLNWLDAQLRSWGGTPIRVELPIFDKPIFPRETRKTRETREASEMTCREVVNSFFPNKATLWYFLPSERDLKVILDKNNIKEMVERESCWISLTPTAPDEPNDGSSMLAGIAVLVDRGSTSERLNITESVPGKARRLEVEWSYHMAIADDTVETVSFDQINRYLSLVAEMPITKGIDQLRYLSQEAARTVSLFGLEIDAGHALVVMPTVIGLTLLFIVAYLGELTTLAPKDRPDALWLGLSLRPLSRILTVLGLVFVPSVAVIALVVVFSERWFGPRGIAVVLLATVIVLGLIALGRARRIAVALRAHDAEQRL